MSLATRGWASFRSPLTMLSRPPERMTGHESETFGRPTQQDAARPSQVQTVVLLPGMKRSVGQIRKQNGYVDDSVVGHTQIDAGRPGVKTTCPKFPPSLPLVRIHQNDRLGSAKMLKKAGAVKPLQMVSTSGGRRFVHV